ncbi:methyltransferase domain-containing protein [Clostridium sp. D2Q-11]|uniref:Methyltransferase domain-containing protein n=1 Tax=Anaeromonas frigoriresistens TaxID=2683708 RepID=A0A942URJ3_9FIRM|nr:class I SAM-dependent methyltransferase [Anaeromonas frigoriresistens]MBS4537268.1 methyltransferase domain-containing protein [Anaeromonas frigoriresistens]
MTIFDKEAKSYDSWYDTKLGNFVDKVERKCAFDLFLPFKGMKVLDIGCGTGNYSIRLAEKGCEVIGIDISDEMLEIARDKAREKNLDIKFYNMDVYNLNFEDENFDGVFSMAAFEFIKYTKKALDEIFRVAKTDGQVLIGTINKDSAWGELYMSNDFKENSVFKYADFKTKEDFNNIFPDNIVDINECLFIPPSIKPQDISVEKEEELSHSKRGGFICVLWKK